MNKLQTIAFSPSRFLLFVYFLTFGFFGFGSDLELKSPLTFLPALSGLVVGVILMHFTRRFGIGESIYIQLKLKHAAVFFFIFGALVLSNFGNLASEPQGDELAYVRLSNIHAIKLLPYLSFMDSDMVASDLIRLTSLALITTCIIPISYLIFKLAPRLSIALAVLSAALFQVAYSFMGGWGWGYPKSAWFPYMVTSTLFGASAQTFRLTSIALVSIGLAILYFNMERLFVAPLVKYFVLGIALFAPLASEYFASIDHVIYFVVFALPVLPYLSEFSSKTNLHTLVPFLAVGALVRAPVAIVLAALLIGQWRAWINPQVRMPLARSIALASLLLVPYGFSLLISPPVFSGREPLSLIDLFDLEHALMAFSEAFSQGAMIIVCIVLLLGMSFAVNRLGLTVLTSAMALFYFFLLNTAGLVGEPKYSVEWALALTILTLIVPFRLFAGQTDLKYKIGRRLLFGFSSALLILNIFESTNSQKLSTPSEALEVGYQSAVKELDSRDLPCVPVGVVYGSANEYLYGRSISNLLFAEMGHAEVILQNGAQGLSWGKLTRDVAAETGYMCFYGSRSAFVDLEAWLDWEVLKFSRQNSTSSVVILLEK